MYRIGIGCGKTIYEELRKKLEGYHIEHQKTMLLWRPWNRSDDEYYLYLDFDDEEVKNVVHKVVSKYRGSEDYEDSLPPEESFHILTIDLNGGTEESWNFGGEGFDIFFTVEFPSGAVLLEERYAEE